MHHLIAFARRGVAVPLCLALLAATPVLAQPVNTAHVGASRAIPNSLLSIDMNRGAVIERVLTSWSAELPKAHAASFATQLNALRADELLAVSLAGSFDSVLEIMQASQRSPRASGDRAKALGEVDRDLVYTPISPCRFIETRTAYPNFGIPYYGAGQFAAGEIRNYVVGTACGLPSGVTALQAQVQGQATAGAGANLEATKGGGPFGGGITLVAANSPLFTVVSAAVPLNLGTNSVGIQVTVSTAHVVMDVVGYFMPANRTGDGLRVFGAGTNAPSVVNGDDSNTVGAATAATISGGNGNTATGNSSTVSGGSANTASGNNSTVAGGVLNQALGLYSSISGGQQNKTAADQGAIGGGLVNDIAVGAFQSTIAGGYNNKITNYYAAIGGGANNTASGGASVVSGGVSNTASGSSSVIAGGFGNKVLGYNSVVSGGGAGTTSNCYNHASDTSPNPSDQPCWNETGGNNGVIGGGYNNRIAAVADTSAVSSGSMNRVNSSGSFIGGGVANTTSGNLSTIVGGRRHIASGSNSFVGGGDTNTASGSRAFVGGGAGNKASGPQSVVAGGGVGTASNCFNFLTAVGDQPCWNEASGGGSFVGSGSNNFAIGDLSLIVGGSQNVVSTPKSSIVGGIANTINADATQVDAFIGGGRSNLITGLTASDAVIVGGRLNTVSGFAAFIGAGRGNIASGDRSAVVGGGSDAVTCWNRVTGLFDQPCANNAAGRRNFIGAGVGNKTNGNESVISGGQSNEATGSLSTVGGGFGNLASGINSVIAGGGSSSINTCFNRTTGLNDGPCQNIASGDFSVISGGIGNVASGRQSTISGGSTNLATAERASIGGGVVNTASGLGATVPGGRANWASGAWSLAAGRGATTNDGAATPTPHFGTFVWSDTPDDGSSATPAATQLFYSSASNQFAVRARGGVVFKVDNVAVPANAGDATAGCSLPAGGSASWSCSSDRNLKEAIRAISPKQILAKVTVLPLSTWQFKGTERRHMSPMAQDFWAAFGLGVNDKAITSSDVSGVALGAIQGLDQKLSAQIKHKDAEIAQLKRDMAAIKKKLGL